MEDELNRIIERGKENNMMKPKKYCRQCQTRKNLYSEYICIKCREDLLENYEWIPRKTKTCNKCGKTFESRQKLNTCFDCLIQQ